MRRFLSKSMSVQAALAICSASGAHWVLFQSVAWAGMVVSYAQDRPLTDAVSDTFGGEHPCDMCNAIASSRNDEKQSKSPGLSATTQKVLLYLVSTARVIPPDGPRTSFQRSADHGWARRDAPPSPPPRVG